MLIPSPRPGGQHGRDTSPARKEPRDHERGPSSHVAMVSHPDEVAQLIKTAAATYAATA